MKMMAVLVPTLFLSACGSAGTPQDQEPLVDGRGAHAGAFHPAGAGNVTDATGNSEIGNGQ